MSRIGEWVYITLPTGIAFPGQIITEPVEAKAKTRAGREFTTYRADVITQREANPAGANAGKTYKQKSNEDLGFAYPRDEAVIGLDAHEDGTVKSFRELIAETMADRLAFATEQYAARPPVAALPGLDVEAELMAAGIEAGPSLTDGAEQPTQ